VKILQRTVLPNSYCWKEGYYWSFNVGIISSWSEAWGDEDGWSNWESGSYSMESGSYSIMGIER
jgi:hypothetical protein